MRSSDVLSKIHLMGEACLQPYCCLIDYYHGSWTLTVTNKLWINAGTPKMEIIGSMTEFLIGDEARPFYLQPMAKGPHPDYPQIEVSGGSKAPDLVIDLPGGAAMEDQYAALHQDLKKSLNTYAWDTSTSDPSNKWFRFCFDDYMPEEWIAARHRVMDRKKPKVSTIWFDGGKMLVRRKCGCVTRHWQAPNGKSKRAFGRWLAERECLDCGPVKDSSKNG